jgi:hypothetical protein
MKAIIVILYYSVFLALFPASAQEKTTTVKKGNAGKRL